MRAGGEVGALVGRAIEIPGQGEWHQRQEDLVDRIEEEERGFGGGGGRMPTIYDPDFLRHGDEACAIYSLCVSPDGSRLATGGQGEHLDAHTRPLPTLEEATGRAGFAALVTPYQRAYARRLPGKPPPCSHAA